MKRLATCQGPGPVLVLGLFLLLTGCGGGGDDGGTAPGPPPGDDEAEPLWEETTAALDDASVVLAQGLGAVPLRDLFQSVAGTLADHPCVASVVLDSNALGDPQLVAEFTNGIVLVMPVIRADSLNFDAEPRRIPPRQNGAKGNALPTGTSVLLLDNTLFDTDAAVYKRLLDGVGYNADYRYGYGVDDFRNIGRFDVVHITTHGMLIKHRGKGYFAMETTQVRSTTEELAMLRAGDFRDVSVVLEDGVYIEANMDPYHPDMRVYGVTDRFFAKYGGSFPNNSLFYANACESMKPSGLPQGIPLATTLSDLNLGTLIGWDDSVLAAHAFAVSNLMVGWLMGDMDASLRWIAHPPTPFRPWSLVDSFAALQRSGNHQDANRTEMIVLTLAGTPEPLLRPTISQALLQVDPEAGTEELKLLGDFGDVQGTAAIYEDPTQAGSGAGTALTVSEWTPEHVILQIDEETAGYVVVKSGTVRSNAHPLSRWEGDMDVAGVAPTGIGPQFELTMHTGWRAEIVPERVQPDGLPNDQAGWTGTLFGKAADCDFNFFGTFEDSRYIYEYPEGANQGTQPMSQGDSQMYFGSVTLKPSESKAAFQIMFARQAMVLKTDKQNPEASPVPDQVMVYIVIMFEAQMSAEGVIAEGQLAAPYDLSWPEMEPEYPVREDTGR